MEHDKFIMEWQLREAEIFVSTCEVLYFNEVIVSVGIVKEMFQIADVFFYWVTTFLGENIEFEWEQS